MRNLISITARDEELLAVAAKGEAVYQPRVETAPCVAISNTVTPCFVKSVVDRKQPLSIRSNHQLERQSLIGSLTPAGDSPAIE